MSILGEVRVGGLYRVAATALGALLVAAAGAAEAQPVPEPASKPLAYSVMLTPWVGMRQARFDALNRALSRHGFAPIKDVAPIAGLDLGMGLGRVHLVLDYGGEWWSTRRQRTGTVLHASTFDVMVMLSYDVVQRRHLAVFMSTGIGGAGLSFNARTPGLGLFRDLRPSDSDRVHYSYGVVPLVVGADNFITISRDRSGDEWVLQLGTRVAYLGEIRGGWYTYAGKNERSLRGPPVDASGLRVRLVIGIGGHHGW